MLMVIFGAGASFDSFDNLRPSTTPGRAAKGSSPATVNDPESRPPLADYLFEQRGFFDPWLEKYHEVVPAVTRLRRHAGSTLEQEVAKLLADAERDPDLHIQLHAVKYYLRGVLRNCSVQWLRETKRATNYASLLNDIRVWHKTRQSEAVRLVTFNYDTLLEDACTSALQMPFRSISSYVSNLYRVYKPHGSVNWVRVLDDETGVDANNVEHSIIALGGSLQLRAGFHLETNLESTTIRDDTASRTRYTYPALALPVDTKSKFECPDDHIERLAADVPVVTKLLVIGWRATEPYFLTLWKQSRPNSVPDSISKIAIVAGDFQKARAVENELRTAGIEGKYVCSSHGFSEFVTGDELSTFLAD